MFLDKAAFSAYSTLTTSAKNHLDEKEKKLLLF